VRPINRPTRAAVEFRPGATCFLIDHALDQTACRRLVERATAAGFLATDGDYPSSYRDNDRLVCDDAALAARLFRRLRRLLPHRLVDRHGDVYRLRGLNERFRFCRYANGQQFRIHRDGAHAGADRERSLLTLQVYLDDGGRFAGGRTRFYAGRHGPLIGAVSPRGGTAIVFDHDLWHDGEPVTGGTKHVVRTDVVYVRERTVETGDLEDPRTGREEQLRGHRGYIWAVVALSDGSLVSASRDRTIRRWRLGAGSWQCVGVLRGHEGSVHAVVEARPGVLFSGSRDHTVRVWDVAASASRVVHEQSSAVLCLTTLGNGLVAGGSGDATIRLFGGEGEPRGTFTGHRGWVWSLRSLGAGLLVSASEDGSVRLWDSDGRSCLDVSAPGHGPAHALARLDDATVVAGFADGTVVVHAIDHGRARLEPVRAFPAHQGEIYAVEPLPGGLLATGGEDDCARVYRMSDGVRVQEVRHRGFVRSIAAVDGRVVASGGYDAVLRVWCADDATFLPPRVPGALTGWPCRTSA